ncbi:hypothetical protein PNEG_00697 [Pneumocystis murina B123]|uniref:Origin recognition complex subunit 2 n=1 Tax=Pneumocystis murina (strain B123) TaxID=1069680 RepID=M7PKU9_PNEMU|nr:hypothetical protein PNEG_00697 [Pneumocystis murina B123]EMR11099.1 hypothetical protein PNEG_00697 [Pneumocystis murina B123]
MMSHENPLDRWFLGLKTKVTSNNRLPLNLLTREQTIERLLSAEYSYKILYENHRSLFIQWMFELNEGFSLIVYGLGSKRSLLMEFIERYFKDKYVLIMNGYKPEISLKGVFNTLISNLWKDRKFESNATLYEMTEWILEWLEEDSYLEFLVWVVHNIDGRGLRSKKVQTCLSRLANAKKIRFVASVDHINSGLLWDEATVAKFQFIWHDATTFAPYLIETSFEYGLWNNMKGSHTDGIQYVLETLTPHAREVYRILIEQQIEAKEKAKIESITIDHLYGKCAEEMVVSSKEGFRMQLREFCDHEMIKLKRDVTGTEIIWIPLEKEVLESILEDLRNTGL